MAGCGRMLLSCHFHTSVRMHTRLQQRYHLPLSRVVPSSFSTESGSLHKGRALEFHSRCKQPPTNRASVAIRCQQVLLCCAQLRQVCLLTSGLHSRSNVCHVASQTSTDVMSERKSTGLKGKDVILEYYNVSLHDPTLLLLTLLWEFCLR